MPTTYKFETGKRYRAKNDSTGDTYEFAGRGDDKTHRNRLGHQRNYEGHMKFVRRDANGDVIGKPHAVMKVGYGQRHDGESMPSLVQYVDLPVPGRGIRAIVRADLEVAK